MSFDWCTALPRKSMGLSAVCVCGISRSYSLTIFDIFAVMFVMFPCVFVTFQYDISGNFIVS